MRPVLRPGLPLLRRDAQTLQLGLDPASAVVVDDCPAVRAVLAALDGVRREDQVVTAAGGAAGVGPAAAAATLAELCRWGVVCDADELIEAIGALPEPSRDRLAADVTAMALVGPPRELARRRRAASVTVCGLATAGSTAARQLAVAGIGRLVLNDAAMVPPTPGIAGVEPAQRPGRRHAWLRDELRRVAPWTSVSLGPSALPADVVLLAPAPEQGCSEADRDLCDGLIRSGTPHCVVSFGEATGVIGPFVVPGQSACLRCLDLARRDEDPAWPVLLSQLTGMVAGGRGGGAAADSTLAALAGTWAALEILGYLQGLPISTVGATLEVSLVGPTPTRRTWGVHPACGCQWDQRATMDA
jgi:hypothetical protein